MKRAAFRFLLLILLFMPLCSLAEVWTEDQFYPSGNFARRHYLFKDEQPAPLVEPLKEWGYVHARVLSGAAIEEPGDNPPMTDEPGSYPSFTALMLLDVAGKVELVGAAWVEGQPWQVVSFDTRLLRRTTRMGMGIIECPGMERPAFAVSYWDQPQCFDLFTFRGNRLWEMVGHRKSDLIISTAGQFTLTIDDAGQKVYHALPRRFYMESMPSIDEYPTTLAECEALTYPTASPEWHHTGGAHLREEPSQQARSLGLYEMDVPVRFFGETKPGSKWPWYRVRIGDTEGWMSGQYVYPDLAYPAPALSVGRTVNGCTMLRVLGDSSSAVPLAPGTDFHILAETADGWRHVCIPGGPLTPEMDLDGTYGYVHRAEMITGAGPRALDALEMEMKKTIPG